MSHEGQPAIPTRRLGNEVHADQSARAPAFARQPCLWPPDQRSVVAARRHDPAAVKAATATAAEGAVCDGGSSWRVRIAATAKGAVLETKVQTAGVVVLPARWIQIAKPTTIGPLSKCLFAERCSLTATAPAKTGATSVKSSRSEIESLDCPDLRGASRSYPDAPGRDACHVMSRRRAEVRRSAVATPRAYGSVVAGRCNVAHGVAARRASPWLQIRTLRVHPFECLLRAPVRFGRAARLQTS